MIWQYDIQSDGSIANKSKFTNFDAKGKKPSNISFGGTDGKTCFVTLADRGCIESFRTKKPGAFYRRIH